MHALAVKARRCPVSGAALHSETWDETVLAADLIPHMLTQFILREKAWGADAARTLASGSSAITRSAVTADYLDVE